jgi:hypothetical protein
LTFIFRVKNSRKQSCLLMTKNQRKTTNKLKKLKYFNVENIVLEKCMSFDTANSLCVMQLLFSDYA